MNWEEVRTKLSTELVRSGPEKSDAKSLIQLSRKAERVGMSPEVFTTPGINNLRTIIRPLRDAAIDDNVEGMKSLLKAAAEKNITDLRLHLGKKVAEVPARQMGDVVVAMFTREQYEKTAHRLRAYLKFIPN